jgi:hypothetical protein
MGKAQQTGKFMLSWTIANISILQKKDKGKGKLETQGKMLIKIENIFLISKSGENQKFSGNKDVFQNWVGKYDLNVLNY